MRKLRVGLGDGEKPYMERSCVRPKSSHSKGNDQQELDHYERRPSRGARERDYSAPDIPSDYEPPPISPGYPWQSRHPPTPGIDSRYNSPRLARLNNHYLQREYAPSASDWPPPTMPRDYHGQQSFVSSNGPPRETDSWQHPPRSPLRLSSRPRRGTSPTKERPHITTTKKQQKGEPSNVSSREPTTPKSNREDTYRSGSVSVKDKLAHDYDGHSHKKPPKHSSRPVESSPSRYSRGTSSTRDQPRSKTPRENRKENLSNSTSRNPVEPNSRPVKSSSSHRSRRNSSIGDRALSQTPKKGDKRRTDNSASQKPTAPQTNDEASRGKDIAILEPKREATEDDRRLHGIPPNFDVSNWDPNEKPFTLAEGVFDCLTIGKWIYDSTSNTYEQSRREVEEAAELWLLLVFVCESIKIFENALPKFEDDKSQVLREYLRSGQQRLQRFQLLLSDCDEPLFAKPKSEEENHKAAVEFVQNLFKETGDKTRGLLESMRQLRAEILRDCQPYVGKELDGLFLYDQDEDSQSST
ncbi:hypothetical protein HD806DRAFT_294072 [Xylariaceae sp. AK1471]|nr:hypothetical protein HD806DRAFT_294072 [Xylariaceae sp. AK1471]